MFTNKISNDGYGVQNYSVASLKPYIRFSKERVLNASIQEELFNFEFPYKSLNHSRHLALINQSYSCHLKYSEIILVCVVVEVFPMKD